MDIEICPKCQGYKLKGSNLNHVCLEDRFASNRLDQITAAVADAAEWIRGLKVGDSFPGPLKQALTIYPRDMCLRDVYYLTAVLVLNHLEITTTEEGVITRLRVVNRPSNSPRRITT